MTKAFTTIKKLKTRGQKFFDEKHIDSDTVYSKQNDDYFLVKGKCSASKKQVEYKISLVISKRNKEIIFSHCECKAGDGGLCSHSYATMKIKSMWSMKGLNVIPSEESCTSKPCQWSQRKTAAHTDQKVPLCSIPIKRKISGAMNISLYDRVS